MIHIGEYNELEILRHTSVGLFLGDQEGNDILLPNKYVPEHYHIGDKLKVFCYLDHDERPVATTLTPKVTLNHFGLLKAVSVSALGAFMDWGLEKHLFVPFREQARKMEEGKWYLIYLYLDEQTGRLVGSSKTDRFLNNNNPDVRKFDEVDLKVYRFTDMGMEVVINNKYKGLVYKDQIFDKHHLGEELKGVILKVREDNKIDVSLSQLGFRNLEPSAGRIMEVLKSKGGFLPLHDHSEPDEIREQLGMSKKSFKKAIGVLYKQKLVEITGDGVRLSAKA